MIDEWQQEVLEGWLKEQPAATSGMYTYSGNKADWRGMAESPAYSSLIGEIRAEGERLLGRPIPVLTQEIYDLFETTGNRLIYEGLYFERRSRLTSFALLHCLLPEVDEYRQALMETIEAILEEKTWCLPAHMKGQSVDRHIDLFASETGFALAEIMTITELSLPPSLREAIRTQIERRLFIPYLDDQYPPYHWETADHNWAAVCAGSIGSAALLLGIDSDRKAAIIHRAIGTMNYYLSGFGEDGACAEGPGYWNYGFGYYVYFADLLKRATGGKADLLASEHVKTIARFQQKAYLVQNRPANFSDASSHVSVNIGLSDYLASQIEEVSFAPLSIRAGFTDDHCSRFAHALRNLIWFRPDAPRQSDWTSGSSYLADAQWLISRVSNEAGSFGFAAKGGHNHEPHNHIDVGHFILIADDDPAFAVDLGSGEYTAQYFGEGRYEYDCTGAQGHSLPIVKGRLQAPGADSAAVVTHVGQGENEDRFELELGACYPGSGLASYRRQFIWHKTSLPELDLMDTFRFDQEGGAVTEVIVSKCVPIVQTEGRILLKGSRHSVILSFEPQNLEISIMERLYSNHSGQEERYYRIYLISKDEASLEHTFKLNFKFQE
jgi:Heparinase II/III-like protein.